MNVPKWNSNEGEIFTKATKFFGIWEERVAPTKTNRSNFS